MASSQFSINMACISKYILLIFLAMYLHLINLSNCNANLNNNFPLGSLICKTYDMTKMDCSNRSLREIPVLEQNSTTLLDLRFNFVMNITNAPFEKLHELVWLDLFENEINYLSPGAFNGLYSLRELSLANNKLVDLPQDVFSDLYNLTILYMSYNSFTAIPCQALAPLHSLRLLTFRNNYGDIPEIDLRSIQNLTALNTLYLYISGLETNVSSTALHPLENLRLEVFAFGRWWKNGSHSGSKDVFAPITGIKSLTTKMVALPAMASLHTPLESLLIGPDQIPVEVLNKTTFQILQKWKVSLKQLQVTLASLKKVEDFTFIWIPNLLNLSLDNNQIQYLAKGAFHGLKSLQKLILSRNALSEIPIDALMVFRSYKSLKHLDLSSNKIATFLDIFSPVFSTSLTYLKLDASYKNSISSTNYIITRLQRLKHLSLSRPYMGSWKCFRVFCRIKTVIVTT